MGVIVQLSEVSDGSMYDRTDPLNKAVIANRRRWLGAQNISLEQTTRLFITYDENNSYVSYRPLTAADRGRGMEDGVIESADAIITTTPGHALFLPVADCIATTLYDPDNQVLSCRTLAAKALKSRVVSARLNTLSNTTALSLKTCRFGRHQALTRMPILSLNLITRV